MFFLKLHPLIVQFPVGLLVSGVLLLAYGRSQKEEAAVAAGNFNLRLGFWCALATLGVGLLGVLNLQVKPGFKPFLSQHILYAFSTVFLFGTALALKRFGKGNTPARVFYSFLLLAGLFSVLAAGYFGGELVHRFGVSTLHPAE